MNIKYCSKLAVSPATMPQNLLDRLACMLLKEAVSLGNVGYPEVKGTAFSTSACLMRVLWEQQLTSKIDRASWGPISWCEVLLNSWKVGLSYPGSDKLPPALPLHLTTGWLVSEGNWSAAHPPASCRIQHCFEISLISLSYLLCSEVMTGKEREVREGDLSIHHRSASTHKPKVLFRHWAMTCKL